MSVLFVSSRPLERAENLKTVWDAFDCDKVFTRNRPFYQPIGDEVDYRLAAELGFELIVTDDYLEPLNSPEDIAVVDIGHGIDGGKVCGVALDYMDERWTHQVDFYVTASEAASRIRSFETKEPMEKMLPLGIPRTDAYFSDGENAGFIFVAPTFRKPRDGEAPVEYDVASLGRALDGFKVVLKPHPESQTIYESSGNVEVASKDIPSSEYLRTCSLLVTDYSSILFDAVLAGKPVVAFALDAESYLAGRGMYLPYPDGYARFWSMDYDGLGEACEKALADPRPTDSVKELIAACDGHSTERVIALLKSFVR